MRRIRKAALYIWRAVRWFVGLATPKVRFPNCPNSAFLIMSTSDNISDDNSDMFAHLVGDLDDLSAEAWETSASSFQQEVPWALVRATTKGDKLLISILMQREAAPELLDGWFGHVAAHECEEWIAMFSDLTQLIVMKAMAAYEQS